MNEHTTIHVSFAHRVHFAQDVLSPGNPLLVDCLGDPGANATAGAERAAAPRPLNVPRDAGGSAKSEIRNPKFEMPRVLAFLDTQVAQHWPSFCDRLHAYAAAHSERMQLAGRVQPVVGGELCKNDRDAIYRVLNAINDARLDRQSYVLAIGGGAVLDCVGFAAAIAHRGMRLIRMPTTTLAQCDSGVGVKNGINGFGQKNYLGSFAVPWAVINDEQLLTTLSDRDWRAGFSEAVKVALLKDRALFERIARDARAIDRRDMTAALPVLRESARLHLEHITQAGDPFELTHARPLDFGHWAAHQLEQMSDFAVRHGEAVAVGLALDVTYARLIGLLSAADASAVCRCLSDLGFALFHPSLRDHARLLAGLDAFREHLGGPLTLTLLRGIGQPVDVHTVDRNIMTQAIEQLDMLAV